MNGGVVAAKGITMSKVYQAIAAVQAELATDGISKEHKNSQQGYNFRGIDDVYNALAPVLSKHGLCILPRIINREMIERQTKTGNALFYVTVDAEFDFVCAEDGSKHTVKTYGEAMDSADKATNKAMSAAYKYAAFQSFCIPTEGDNDADKTTHEVKPENALTNTQQRTSNTPPPAAEENKAGTKLMNTLLDWCQGDEQEAAFRLRQYSEFEKDGKTHALKMADLANPKYAKWCGSTLGRVEKAIKDQSASSPADDDIPF